MNSGRTTSLRWTVFASTLLVLAIVVLCIEIAPPAAILYTVATFLLFMLPGILVGPVLFGKGSAWLPERIIFGAIIGIAASGYTAIVVGVLYGWSPKGIVVAILGLSCACAAIGRVFRDHPLLPLPRKWTAADFTILSGMCLVVVLFVASPYLHVGKLTSRGYAYTWLFGLDFLWRSDAISAMTVHLPPDLLWMTGNPVRMYLVGYAMPAFAYAAGGKLLPLHSIVLLTILGSALLMLASLYAFLRTLFSDTRVLASSAYLVLFAYSYYWVYAFVKRLVATPGVHTGLLIDPKFWNYDGVSHLFQRSFLVEPQAALASSILLVMLSMLALIRYRLKSIALGTFFGICLGITFGTDALQGLIVVAWFGLLYLVRFIRAKGRFQDEYLAFAAAVLSCGAISGSFFLLGMYQLSTSHMVKFQFNSWIALFGIGFFPVEFGPLIFLGLWGMFRWWRQSRGAFAWPLLLLAAIVLLQVAFVAEPPVSTPRMADRLLPIVLLVFAAYLFRDLWSARLSGSNRTLTAGILLAALPTFFSDIYFTSNIQDPYTTRYVRTQDQQACDWIRKNLPETAVIQGETQYFVGADHGEYLNLIASFSGRPQVLGWNTGAAVLVADGWQICVRRIPDIQAMLDATDSSQLIRILQKYSINYVYVGPFEQERHKTLLGVIQSSPDQFREVYSQNEVHIFRYLTAGVDSAHLTGVPAVGKMP
jgi:hypothetical protein